MTFNAENLWGCFSIGTIAKTTDGAEDILDTSPKFPLLQLPSEILIHVLSFLSPVALATICCTCRSLKLHAEDERLWARTLADVKLPDGGLGPSPFGKWKDLYAAHYPYWFLPKHKIWFSNKAAAHNNLAGQLILARYDYRMGMIEAYRLVAEQSDDQEFGQWELDPTVIIHQFRPKVHLHLDDPVIQLDAGGYGPGGRMKKEVMLHKDTRDTNYDGIKARIFPTIAIPPSKQSPSMALWPPANIPAMERVRSDSSNLFHDARHKPSCYDEVSQTTFRLRKWMDFGSMMQILGRKMAEDVMTWSTLPEECYTSTLEKPYQGIWVGDYSGHGCEFLVLIQKTAEEAQDIPRITPIEVGTWAQTSQPGSNPAPSPARPTETGPNTRPAAADPLGCTGRLEAIKLTGDPNIPRGEYTWIAEDIGRNGLIRVATERNFKGARIVKSVGHIADRNFQDGEYAIGHLDFYGAQIKSP